MSAESAETAARKQNPNGEGTAHTLIIGGKSMGGRVASMIADELFDADRIAGLLCVGYPDDAGTLFGPDRMACAWSWRSRGELVP